MGELYSTVRGMYDELHRLTSTLGSYEEGTDKGRSYTLQYSRDALHPGAMKLHVELDKIHITSQSLAHRSPLLSK